MLNRLLIFNRLNWRLRRRNATPPPIKKNTTTNFNQVSPIPHSYQKPYYTQKHKDNLTNPLIKAIEQSKISHKQKVVEMQRENQRKLDELVEKSSHELLCVKSAFPFNLFPDELIIDANKVSIIYRQFLAAEQIRTIIIKDIEDVWVESIPFFATLKIKSVRAIELDIIVIRNLTKNDAVKAQRLIQGLMLSEQQEVELAEVNKENLDEKMEKLGKADSIVGQEL